MKRDPARAETPRIAIVDADSIIFAVASTAEMRMSGPTPEEDQWFQVKSEQEALAEVIAKIEALVGDSGAEDAIVCLSSVDKCFRYAILPTYKGNRKGARAPALRGVLTEALVEACPYNVLRVSELEADDVCGISAGSLQRARDRALAAGGLPDGAKVLREPVIVSIDKDMLQIPGWNYNPGVHGNGYASRLTFVTREMADRHFLYQTLIGDGTDGYTGCPGVGPTKANKLLDDCAHLPMGERWKWIVEAFRKKGLDEAAALVQARVARILRVDDWDPIAREITLWEPDETEEGELVH